MRARIGRSILEQLEKFKLFEMACDRKTFKKIVQDSIDQIIENWCLINYANITGNCSSLKHHWKVELQAQCKRVVSANMKENNSYNSRYKVIKTFYCDAWEYNSDPQLVYDTIVDKFHDEKIYDKKIIKEVSQNMSDEILYLVDILSTGNMSVLKNYINDL